MRHERFTFVCSRKERRTLSSLSEKLARTQSGTVRWLIREKSNELGLKSSPLLDPEHRSSLREFVGEEIRSIKNLPEIEDG